MGGDLNASIEQRGDRYGARRLGAYFCMNSAVLIDELAEALERDASSSVSRLMSL